MDELLAPVAGTVIRVAAAGARVAPGEAVAVVESMKMEYEVVAEFGGEVTRVDVAVGETIAEGTVVATLAAAGEGAAGAALDAAGAGGEARAAGDGGAAGGPAAAGSALDAVLARHALGLDDARPEAVARRRAQGRRTARENVADLVDAGTFVEYGPLVFAAQERRRPKQELIERTPADGLVGGLGDIDGR